MFLNLKLVQKRGNLLGETIISNYETDPGGVLEVIRGSYRDNPEAVIETISMSNAIALGLVDPISKFKYYFHRKDDRSAIRGIMFSYDTLSSLFKDLSRANGIISTWGLRLRARSTSRGVQHTLFIDEL